MLLTVTPRPGPPLRGFMFSAALVLLVRINLVHRQDVQLIGEVMRSREQLAKAGVDYDDVTETLEREGVEKFAASFDELMASLGAKQHSLAPA